LVSCNDVCDMLVKNALFFCLHCMSDMWHVTVTHITLPLFPLSSFWSSYRLWTSSLSVAKHKASWLEHVTCMNQSLNPSLEQRIICEFVACVLWDLSRTLKRLHKCLPLSMNIASFELTTLWQYENEYIVIIICRIAIAYNMAQIIKSVCICQRICVSICAHSHGRISGSIFTKIGTDVRTPKSKNEFVGGQHPFPHFPQNPHFRPKGPENPCKY